MDVTAFLSALTGPGSADLFADPFLFADASGARQISRADFLASLPRRAQSFANAGYGRAELTSADELRLDEHHLLLRTEWTMPSHTGGDAAELASSYLLREDGPAVHVIAYLNHKTAPAAGSRAISRARP